MASSEAPVRQPVERFGPTSGQLVGYTGLTMVLFGVGYVALRVHTVTGLQVALGLAVLGVLVWATQLRPRAALYPETLLLRNSLVDTSLPLRLVEEVSVTRTLNVWVAGKRHVGLGIGRSMRSIFKTGSSGAASLLGAGRLHAYAENADRPHPDQTAMSYETFVVNRIEAEVERAKAHPSSDGTPAVRRQPAWPEIVALAGTAAAFGVSLLL